MGKRIVSHPVEFYKTFWKQEWRWRIKANNGKIIASASEGYNNKQDCIYNSKSTAASINKHFRDEAKEIQDNKNKTGKDN